MNRRNALISTGLFPLSMSIWRQAEEMAINIPEGLKILFQGDSITDAGRNRGSYYANDGWGMGNGYVSFAVKQLLGTMPEKGLKCYNRGISGHKVHQLANRWEDDCLNLRPDVMSILIGVNDYWHTLTHGYTGDIKTYRTDLDALLKRTKDELPDMKLIILEPFVLKEGTAIKESDWLPMFDEFRMASKDLAQNFGAEFVPYQSMFDAALSKADTAYWCPDGVHPSMAGAHLMAQGWLEAFSRLNF